MSAPDVLTQFHPAVAEWFRSRFPAPTEAQVGAWPVTAGGGHALIAAPTGSGKTLAAFLSAIDGLVVDGLARGLPDAVQVLYVSPLKALSNDIQKNLQAPLAGIRDKLLELGLPDVPIRDAVRTGDTPQFERERMRKVPPHILVTTPESLFILLTSDSGRAMLKAVKTVIVDELHALAGSKRGAHLMLSLERLEGLVAEAGNASPVRIGLSATVKPVEEMGRYLVGCRDAKCTVIDTGHIRQRDLALVMPNSPLDTVMSHEVWAEVYDKLAELVRQHRTTLIFVNQRKMAERVARHVGERIGEEHVTAHHGSLAREHRLKAEQRLKGGELKALVATSSLELGIDIGDVDLVCQLGSPRSIAAFLQRVGRAGHAVGAIPKGRLFPLSTDDLVECAALLDSARRGELDRIRPPVAPLDVIAQQIVAETACREWGETELFDALRRATPYENLARADFDKVVQMLAEGYATRRGRRGAHLHHDAVNRRLRARRGAKLTAVTNGGVIPDQFDYDVILLPEGHRVGSLNEDFSFECSPGDIFQLGNTSWRVRKVETGKVFVEDAKGQPPSVPFWLGEALGRTRELSASVSRINATASELLGQSDGALEEWAVKDLGLPPPAAMQLAAYLGASKAALGALPTLDTIIFERFFDEVGDTHLVIHSPYGSRVNKAWGLALRKRFCRQFNFELQAAALEDSIVLSLGPSHSFPLESIKDYLKPATAREILVQALIDAPMFNTRWRWNATTALAIRRMIKGKRAPPQFQRSDSDDLLCMVFPEQVACAENIEGDREVPDHPLVKQTVHDCLHEVMDVDGFLEVLRRMDAGEIKVVARDLAAPSPLAHAVLSTRPYAFLDDGAAEERRTRMVNTHRQMDLETASAIGNIDPAAIERLRNEVQPEPVSADELHDALVVHGFLMRDEGKPWRAWFDQLIAARRATVLHIPSPPRGGEGQGEGPGHDLWVTAERLAELTAAVPNAECTPVIKPTRPAPDSADIALREIVRGRLELFGPVTAQQLAAPLRLPDAALEAALLQLEAEGGVMRMENGQWCERRLLARLHRYTRDKQRAAVQAVPPAQFLRHLFRWQGVAGATVDERREGESGLLAVLRQLEGFSVAAGAWEDDVLTPRVRQYHPELLDRLSSAGRVVWFRPSETADPERRSGPVRSTPIILCERENYAAWNSAPTDPSAAIPSPRKRGEGQGEGPAVASSLSPKAQRLLESLNSHGASFFDDLVNDTGLLRTEVEQGLGELVSQGMTTSDSFAGLRALVVPAERREKMRRYRRSITHDVDAAGRWSVPRAPRVAESAGSLADPSVEHIARVLLRRYGVVFRALLAREDHLPPWRELFYVYRRMEARGEIRGGRFVTGFSGEQFALPEATVALRKAGGEPKPDAPIEEELVSISAADPLNLVGVITPGDKVPALSGNRVLFRNGVPVAVQSGDEVRFLQAVESKSEWEIRNLLIRKLRPGSYLEEQPTSQ
ncbi:MAG TPA: DEAD/DEAH box helicase [Verrucomicrobiae bacterium]|nr:DEAD/DEAH box helicase [Verrucomicrobiae bacterium]